MEYIPIHAVCLSAASQFVTFVAHGENMLRYGGRGGIVDRVNFLLFVGRGIFA